MASNNEQSAKVEAILLRLDYVKAEQPADNRRRAPRLNIRMSLSAVILSAAAPCPVEIHTRNLSMSGLGFVSRRMFKLNERIAIELKVKNLPMRLVLARVTFSRYLSAGLYEMGSEFLECLKEPKNMAVPPHWLMSAATSKVKMGTGKAKEEAVAVQEK